MSKKNELQACLDTAQAWIAARLPELCADLVYRNTNGHRRNVGGAYEDFMEAQMLKPVFPTGHEAMKWLDNEIQAQAVRLIAQTHKEG